MLFLVNMALGPVVSPLGRDALGGRNWEGLRNPSAEVLYIG